MGRWKYLKYLGEEHLFDLTIDPVRGTTSARSTPTCSRT